MAAARSEHTTNSSFLDGVSGKATLNSKEFPEPSKRGPALLSLSLATDYVYTGREIVGRVIVNTLSKKRLSDKQFHQRIGAVRVSLKGIERGRWEQRGQTDSTKQFSSKANALGTLTVQQTLVGGETTAMLVNDGRSLTASDASKSDQQEQMLDVLAELVINARRGLHVYDFQLPVPLELPSSVIWSGKDEQKNPVSAQINYEVVASIESADGRPVHCVTEPIILKSALLREPEVQRAQEELEVIPGAPPFVLRAHLQNSNLVIGETAIVEFSFDNHTNWALQSINLSLQAHWQVFGSSCGVRDISGPTHSWRVFEATRVITSAEEIVSSGDAEDGRSVATVALVPPNCGDGFSIPSVELIIPASATPSVEGQIVHVSYSLCAHARVLDPTVKQNTLRRLLMRQKFNVVSVMPVDLRIPIEPLAPNWSPGSDPVTEGMYLRNSALCGNVAHVLQVHIDAGNDMVSCDRNGKSDPYFKVWLLVDGETTPKKIRSGRSSMQKKTLNPRWDDGMFGFFIHATEVPSKLIIECRDWNLIGHADFMGCAEISMNAVAAALPSAPVARNACETVLDEWILLQPRPNKPWQNVSGSVHVRVGWLSSTASDVEIQTYELPRQPPLIGDLLVESVPPEFESSSSSDGGAR